MQPASGANAARSSTHVRMRVISAVSLSEGAVELGPETRWVGVVLRSGQVRLPEVLRGREAIVRDPVDQLAPCRAETFIGALIYRPHDPPRRQLARDHPPGGGDRLRDGDADLEIPD